MVDKVLHYQMPFTTGGQTVNDRLTAAYHSLAGSQMAKIVCKATTEEPIGPKKKHLDYLLHCTHEPNVNIPQLANCLIERTTNSNWSVVYKSLITIHNLMCYGNERFSQYLASSNANFNLVNFLDKASVQGYDMSTHVRRYAKYITEKIYTYRIMAFDFCKVKRGKEDGMLRTMTADKLLKALPLLQGQIDALLEFQVTSNELINGVINSCFILLFRDLIRLFACYNDGIINLLEKYFDMNKKQCREALDLYKKFLLRMDKVSEFLKVAESVGIDRGEIPDLAKAPGSLLEALEQHLNALEGQKVGSTTSVGRVTSPVSGPSASTQSAIQKFTSTGFTEPKSGYVDPGILDESVKKKILEEEEQRLNMLKEQRMRELEFSSKKHSVDHSTENKSKPVITSGSPPTTSNERHQQNQQALQNKAKASSIDDLLSLDLSVPMASSSANPNTNPFLTGFGYYQQQPDNAFPAAGYSNGHAAFATDDAFARAFGNSQHKQASEPFGDLLTPQSTPTADKNPFASSQPSVSKKPASVAGVADSKLVKGDLDSSLANLAENLSIGRGQENLRNKPVQWGPNKGGSNLAAVGGTSSASSMMTSSSSIGWTSMSAQPAAFSQQPFVGAYPPSVNNWSVPSNMTAGIGMGYSGYGQQPRPAYPVYPATGAGMMAPNQMAAYYQPPRPTTQLGAQDPFGAL